ncbi:MAG: GatB/YqeY domain-containing protein [Bacteroidota bacterium]
MTLQQQLQEDMKAAMKAKDAVTLQTLRMVKSEITKALTTSGKIPTDAMSDDEIIALMKRLKKQRNESIAAFEKAGNAEQVAAEKAELEVIAGYLPEMMSIEAITEFIKEKVDTSAFDLPKDTGRLIGEVVKQLGTAVDGKDVAAAIKNLS